MQDRIALTYDIGTQSLRAILVNNHGEFIGFKQVKYDPVYESPQLGWAERDADSYYEYMCRATAELKDSLPVVFGKIEGVTITCIRDSVVNVDADGRPLRPAILWPDGRQASGEPKLNVVQKTIFGTLGLTDLINMQYKKSFCNWIMENQPEIWEKTYKFMYLSAYLTYRMTGEFTDAVACTVGHMPFDVKTRQWAGPNSLTRPIFDIPEEKLIRVTDSCELMGKITAKAAAELGVKEGTPVYASGSDKACEIVGLGCIKKSQAAVSFGTMATVSLNSPDYLEAERFVPPYPSVRKGWYTPEYELYRGYWLVSWFVDQFCAEEAETAGRVDKKVEEILCSKIGEIEPGCNGLFLSPYFSPDVIQPFARGGFLGLADYHTREHMFRAVIEGINYALMEGTEKIEKHGNFKFEEIRAAGGGSQSSEICQITADMFGIPVRRTISHESSALGAGMAVFVAMGEFAGFEEASENMVKIKDEFFPDTKNTEKYRKLFEVYKKIYSTMKPIYKDLKEIENIK